MENVKTQKKKTYEDLKEIIQNLHTSLIAWKWLSM